MYVQCKYDTLKNVDIRLANSLLQKNQTEFQKVIKEIQKQLSSNAKTDLFKKLFNQIKQNDLDFYCMDTLLAAYHFNNFEYLKEVRQRIIHKEKLAPSDKANKQNIIAQIQGKIKLNLEFQKFTRVLQYLDKANYVNANKLLTQIQDVKMREVFLFFAFCKTEYRKLIVYGNSSVSTLSISISLTNLNQITSKQIQKFDVKCLKQEMILFINCIFLMNNYRMTDFLLIASKIKDQNCKNSLIQMNRIIFNMNMLIKYIKSLKKSEKEVFQFPKFQKQVYEQLNQISQLRDHFQSVNFCLDYLTKKVQGQKHQIKNQQMAQKQSKIFFFTKVKIQQLYKAIQKTMNNSQNIGKNNESQKHTEGLIKWYLQKFKCQPTNLSQNFIPILNSFYQKAKTNPNFMVFLDKQQEYINEQEQVRQAQFDHQKFQIQKKQKSKKQQKLQLQGSINKLKNELSSAKSKISIFQKQSKQYHPIIQQKNEKIAELQQDYNEASLVIQQYITATTKQTFQNSELTAKNQQLITKLKEEQKRLAQKQKELQDTLNNFQGLVNQINQKSFIKGEEERRHSNLQQNYQLTNAKCKTLQQEIKNQKGKVNELTVQLTKNTSRIKQLQELLISQKQEGIKNQNEIREKDEAIKQKNKKIDQLTVKMIQTQNKVNEKTKQVGKNMQMHYNEQQTFSATVKQLEQELIQSEHTINDLYQQIINLTEVKNKASKQQKDKKIYPICFKNSQNYFSLENIMSHIIKTIQYQQISSMKFIYKFSQSFKNTFSKYTKDKKNLLVVCKTKLNQIVGGFTSQGFGSQEYDNNGYGFLFSKDKNNKINYFDLKSQQKVPSQCIKDQIKFGYRQLVIKNGDIIQTDFATHRHQSRGHFSNPNKLSREEFIQSQSKQYAPIKLQDYQIYQVMFKDNNAQDMKHLSQNYQNQIKSMEEKMKQMTEKHSKQLREHREKLDRETQKMRSQVVNSEASLKTLQIQINNQKRATKQMHEQICKLEKERGRERNYDVYFQGEIFDSEPYDSIIWFVDQLESHCQKRIKKTRLLYKKDDNSNINFHVYFDGKPNIVLLIKLKSGIVLAGYSESPFIKGQQPFGQTGLIFSFHNQKVFGLKTKENGDLYSKSLPIIYDIDCITFGNSQIRLRFKQDMLFSNFGILGGYYNNRKQTVDCLIGEQKERESQIWTYEIFQVKF